MANPIRAKRTQTARELAKRFGVTERTIRNTVAQERSEFLKDAAARHEQIRELRSQGHSMRIIAADLGISVGTVHYALNKEKNKDKDLLQDT